LIADNPVDVPTAVVDFLAEQLGIEDSSCLKAYTERVKTPYEHQWEIGQAEGFIDFGETRARAERWFRGRAGLDPGGAGDGAVRRDGVLAARAQGAAAGGQRARTADHRGPHGRR
jgi:hypothetical protein